MTAILHGLRRWQRAVAMVLACYSPSDRVALVAVSAWALWAAKASPAR